MLGTTRTQLLIGIDKASNAYTQKGGMVTTVGILNSVTRKPQKVGLKNGETVMIGSLELPGILYDVMTKPIGQKKRGPTTGFAKL